MRAVKRTVSVLLSLVLVLGMVTVGISAASAATTNKVTVTSNIGANGNIQYTPGVTQQVTVTFQLKTTYRVISTQGVVTFDPAVLKVASSNTAATFAPLMRDGLQVNLNKTDGRIPFNASNPTAYNFRYSLKNYVCVVFDVIGSGDTTVNLEVSNLTCTKLNSGTAESSEQDADIIDTAAGVDKNSFYEGGLELSKTPEDEELDPADFIKGKALNYQGKVGLRIGFIVPDAYSGHNLHATLTSDFSNQIVEIPYDSTTWSSKDKRYWSDFYLLRSIDAASPVHITVYDGNDVLVTQDYCAADYVKAALASSSISQLEKDLAIAYVDFASKAQIYFNHNTSHLANEGITYTAPTVTADDITDDIYQCPDLTAYGLGKASYSLILDADSAIRSMFVLNNETTLKATTVKVNGVITDYQKSSGNAYYDIGNLASNALGNRQKISFAKSGSTAYYNINAYYVAKRILASTSTNQKYKNLAGALYTYGKASVARFGVAS